MKVFEINLKEHFSTTLFDPSPHRFNGVETPVSERQIPLIYNCNNCDESIRFETDSFKKHCHSDFSNLNTNENLKFYSHLDKSKLIDLSFLDFYCPSCKQPTKIFFTCGPSGYWGNFGFEIKSAFALHK